VETYERRNKLLNTRLFFLCQASEIVSTSCLSLILQSSGIYRSVEVWRSSSVKPLKNCTILLDDHEGCDEFTLSVIVYPVTLTDFAYQGW